MESCNEMDGKIRDRLWNKAAQARIPLTIAFELLPICNLSCKMCYVRKSKEEVQKQGGLIETEQWLQWIRAAREEGLLFPLITGGEPFLHPDFWKIYDSMVEMGMQVSINSNGTLITKKIAQRLSVSPPTRINITLYGASEESYEKLCGNGKAFQKVREAVKWLQHYEIPIKFNCSITPYNYGDMEAIMAYAKEVAVPLQMATYMFPPVRRDQSMIGTNDRLTPEEAGLARVKADFYLAEAPWFKGQAERFKRFVPLEKLADLEPGEQRMHCRGGVSSGWIDWKGNLSSCGMYSSSSISLKNNSFPEAWNTLTDEISKMRYATLCAHCPNNTLCHSCVAMVHNENGDEVRRPEYMCKMNEAAAQYYQEYVKRLEE